MTTWGLYLTRGLQPKIYHMCDEQSYLNAIKDGGLYYPPTYSQDGFIHATAEPTLLLDVGTYFYKDVKGDWICLEMDPLKLGREGTVIYEGIYYYNINYYYDYHYYYYLAPAPVGNIEAYDHEKEQWNQPKFPHIYGGINKESVIKTYKIIRSNDGTFLEIEGIVNK